MNSNRSTFARSPSLLLIVLLLLAATAASPFSVGAQSLVLFDVEEGLKSADTDSHSDVAVVRFTITGGTIITDIGNPPPSIVGQTSENTLGDAVAENQVFRFTLTPHNGYTISISSIFFDIAAYKPASATMDQTSQAWLFTSRSATTPAAAGFATDTTADNTPSAFVTWGNDLTANPLYQNISEPIVFSLYVFGSNSSGYTLFLDNIQVNGVTVAVPEPSSVVLVALGGLAVAGCAARRRCNARQKRPATR